MTTYKVNVTREDGWWMVAVPELDRYETADGSTNLSDTTQARRISGVASQARDLICTVTDVAPSQVDLDITISVDDIDVSALAEAVTDSRALAERYATAGQAHAKDLVRKLTAHGVPVRDTAELLDISPQRVSQLAAANSEHAVRSSASTKPPPKPRANPSTLSTPPQSYSREVYIDASVEASI